MWTRVQVNNTHLDIPGQHIVLENLGGTSQSAGQSIHATCKECEHELENDYFGSTEHQRTFANVTDAEGTNGLYFT